MLGSQSEIFLTSLMQSSLLGDVTPPWLEKEVERLRGRDVGEEDVLILNGVAERLVREGALTPWQAQMLASGRKAFFLGRYKLLEYLGSGGMGIVFKAEQRPLGRIVALKTIQQKLLGNPAAVSRFRQEITAAAALVHSNIVTAFDAESAGDLHFLVMEYVQGESLDSILRRRGKLPVGEACEYALQAAEGLQHAYDQGMVHRDVKPANLLVSWSANRAQVKILDFGLSKYVGERAESGEVTSTGEILGTPDYISPEQARSTKTADIRSDIYSLGCTLFHLLSGRVPFVGENAMEKLAARISGPPPRPRQFGCEVPDELESTLLRLLALNPAERYSTPKEVAQALAAFAEPPAESPLTVVNPAAGSSTSDPSLEVDPKFREFLDQLAIDPGADRTGQGWTVPIGDSAPEAEDVNGPPPSTSVTQPRSQIQSAIERRRRAERKHRLWIALGAVGVIALLTGYSLWYRTGDTKLIIDWPLDEREGAFLEINGRETPFSEVQEISITGRSGTVELRATRRGYEPVEQKWQLRWGETVRYRPEWKQTTRSLRRGEWTTLQQRVLNNLSAFGRSPPPFDDQRVVKLRSAILAFDERWTNREADQNPAALLRRLPCAADRLQRNDISEYELTVAGNGDPVQSPRALVAVFGDSRLQHWNQIIALDFSSDGKLVATASIDGSVKVWDAESGRQLYHLAHDQPVTAVAFQPRGTLLASGDATTVKVWETTTGNLVRILDGQTGSARLVTRYVGPRLTFSPDGRLLAACALRENAIVLWAAESGQRIRALPQKAISLSFRGDGAVLAAASFDGIVKLWNVSSGKELRSWNARREIRRVEFDPTNKDRLATETHNALVLWNTTNGEQLRMTKFIGRQFAFLSNERFASANPTAVWNAVSGKRVMKSQIRGACLAVRHDGRLLAVGDYCVDLVTSAVRLIDAKSGLEQRKTDTSVAPVRSIAVARDGSRIVAAQSNEFSSELRFWDLATQKLILRRVVPQGRLLAIALSPDDRLLAGTDQHGHVKVWSMSDFRTKLTFRAVFTLRDAGSQVSSAAFTPDGKTLICAMRNSRVSGPYEVVLWNLPTGRARHRLRVRGPIAISPDGRLLATRESWEHTKKGGRVPRPAVILWNLSTAKPVRTAKFVPGEMEGQVRCFTFSPDSKSLLCGHHPKNGAVTLWDCAGHTGHRLLTEHRTSTVTSVAFSPDGTLVASSGKDGMVRLYDPHKKYNNQVRTIRVGPRFGIINQVRFTPDGRHLVIANQNGTVYILRIEKLSPTTPSLR